MLTGKTVLRLDPQRAPWRIGRRLARRGGGGRRRAKRDTYYVMYILYNVHRYIHMTQIWLNIKIQKMCIKYSQMKILQPICLYQTFTSEQDILLGIWYKFSLHLYIVQMCLVSAVYETLVSLVMSPWRYFLCLYDWKRCAPRNVMNALHDDRETKEFWIFHSRQAVDNCCAFHLRLLPCTISRIWILTIVFALASWCIITLQHKGT